MSKQSQKQQQQLTDRLKNLLPKTPLVKHVSLPQEDWEERPLEAGEARAIALSRYKKPKK